MKNPIYFSLLICFLSINLQAQKLNKTERKIVQAVKNLNGESLLFLEKVVNINSGTLNQKGVKDVGNVFSNAFQEIGFQTQWIEIDRKSVV